MPTSVDQKSKPHFILKIILFPIWIVTHIIAFLSMLFYAVLLYGPGFLIYIFDPIWDLSKILYFVIATLILIAIAYFMYLFNPKSRGIADGGDGISFGDSGDGGD